MFTVAICIMLFMILNGLLGLWIIEDAKLLKRRHREGLPVWDTRELIFREFNTITIKTFELFDYTFIGVIANVLIMLFLTIIITCFVLLRRWINN